MSSLPKNSVIDTAMQILEQDLANGPTPTSPNAGVHSNYDVSDFEVPDFLVEQVTGVKPKTPPKKVQEKRTPEKEKSMEDYLKEFQEVIARGKQLIEQMTSCGTIGVNMAGPVATKSKKKRKLKKLDKNGYSKSS